MIFGHATWTIEDFARNLQLCNEGIDPHKVKIGCVVTNV
jgi:hypothetical protein